MLNLKEIAITGGLCSGKTTVLKTLENLGAYVLSSDQIIHELLSRDERLQEEISKELSIDPVEDDAHFRKKIADKVFSDPNALQKLERILHPLLLKKIKSTIEKLRLEKKYELFACEIPLLFELGWENLFDASIAVFTPENLAKKRYQELGKPKEDFEKRMKRQKSPEEKAALATFTLINHSSKEELKKRTIELYQKLKDL